MLETHEPYKSPEGLEACLLLLKVDLKRGGNYKEMRYYILQLLKEKLTGQLTLWTRWGRLGDRGQNQRTPFRLDEKEALKEFKKVLKQKTKVTWEQLCEAPNQPPPYVPGKYRIVQLGSRNADKSVVSSYQSIKRVMNINTIVRKLEEDI